MTPTFKKAEVETIVSGVMRMSRELERWGVRDSAIAIPLERWEALREHMESISNLFEDGGTPIVSLRVGNVWVYPAEET